MQNLKCAEEEIRTRDFRDKMGCLSWFLPISKNRNLETVAACSGDLLWFDSMIQALLHKCPLKQGFDMVSLKNPIKKQKVKKNDI